MREHLRFDGHIQSATLSRLVDRCFVSYTVQTERTKPEKQV